MARTIRNAMTETPCSIGVADSIVDAARLMRDDGVGSLPVVDEGRLVGIKTGELVEAISEARDAEGW